MKTKQIYITVDGVCWEQLQPAKVHEQKIFEEWLEKHALSDFVHSCPVNTKSTIEDILQELMLWITEEDIEMNIRPIQPDPEALP